MNIRDYSLGQGRGGGGGLPSTYQATGTKEAEGGAGDHPREQTDHLWDRAMLSAAGRPSLDYSEARAHGAVLRLPRETGYELASHCPSPHAATVLSRLHVPIIPPHTNKKKTLVIPKYQ